MEVDLCWYPEESANHLKERTVTIKRILKEDGKSIYYKGPEFANCNSGAPILYNTDEGLQIVGMQIGEIQDNWL